MASTSLKDLTNQAIMALQSGNPVRALELSSRFVQSPQAGHLQRLVFAMAFEKTIVPALVGELKKALEVTLGQRDIDNQRLFPGWYYIFRTSPSYENLKEKDWEKIEPKLQEKFVIEGVRNLNFLDWELEQVFTNLRRDILLKYWPQGLLKTKHLPFLCALAEHGFHNEYVMSVSEEEKSAISKVEPKDPISVALIGCYKPLTNVIFTEKMSAVAAFRSMAKTHAANPRRERVIKTSFGNKALEDEVSGSVQAMYEENPYPRWTSINLPHKRFDDISVDILLAGCGSGHTALGFAYALPACHFTAIDISRTSLAYASRMCESFDVENIQFKHLDILDADKLDASFDYIECSGVLHHMKNPEEGWRVLTSCLKDGGGMQVAFYSRTTRQEINAVRDYIAEKGYKPTLEDIRKLRQDIADLPEGNPLKAVMQMRDFYSTSMVRDLVFHIQEASYDIPELAAMMDRLGLEFDGFKLNAVTQADYRVRFPNDPSMKNLENWSVFEAENPQTFIGMYRMFCHKKGQIITDDVTRIREMQA